jgi:hypothetical protein
MSRSENPSKNLDEYVSYHNFATNSARQLARLAPQVSVAPNVVSAIQKPVLYRPAFPSEPSGIYANHMVSGVDPNHVSLAEFYSASHL